MVKGVPQNKDTGFRFLSSGLIGLSSGKSTHSYKSVKKILELPNFLFTKYTRPLGKGKEIGRTF